MRSRGEDEKERRVIQERGEMGSDERSNKERRGEDKIRRRPGE